MAFREDSRPLWPFVKKWFADNPSATNNTFDFGSVASEIKFGDVDTDLHLAIGDAVVSGVHVQVRVDRLLNGDGSETLKSTEFLLVGSLTDLYDFDYDEGYPNTAGASVQAGYDGVGRLGGHVFKIEVVFSGSQPVLQDHVY